MMAHPTSWPAGGTRARRRSEGSEVRRPPGRPARPSDVLEALFPSSLARAARRVARGEDPGPWRGVGVPDGACAAAAFGSEARCRQLLERLRWPDGARCPRCGARSGISRIVARGQFECGACRYQFSVRVGTVFRSSHVPLWKWVLAAYAVAESGDAVSAARLRRFLGVSHRTALHLSRTLRPFVGRGCEEALRRLLAAGTVDREPSARTGKEP